MNINETLGAKNKIRLVAIAKDEAPYIAEWIHHHLYFGFHEIHIYINRTTDNTIEILDRICSTFTAVTYEVVDWLDLCPPKVSMALQKICYAKDFDYSKNNNIDYVMFLDIDEFWTPEDFVSKITSFTKSDVDAVSFNWHCEVASEIPFQPISMNFSFYVHQLCKSMINTKSRLKTMRLHAPEFDGKNNCIDADNNQALMSKINSQAFIKKLCYPKKSFIVHRMYRSKIEYMATLLRGNPESHSKIKANRPGFVPKGLRDDEITISFNAEHYKEYLSSMDFFYKINNVKLLIEIARDKVLEKSEVAKNYIEKNLQDEVVMKVTKNLGIKLH